MAIERTSKAVTTVKPKLSLEVDEVSLGVSAEHDTKDMKKLYAQAVYKPKGEPSLYWARADLMRNLASAGCDQRLKDYIKHSFEIVYGWKDFKGIQGQPVELRGGVEYDLSDQTSVSACGVWADTYAVAQTVEHKIDSHWTVSCTQEFTSGDLGTKQGPYQIGFAATYKL